MNFTFKNKKIMSKYTIENCERNLSLYTHSFILKKWPCYDTCHLWDCNNKKITGKYENLFWQGGQQMKNIDSPEGHRAIIWPILWKMHIFKLLERLIYTVTATASNNFFKCTTQRTKMEALTIIHCSPL